jgi:hypothetical protein
MCARLSPFLMLVAGSFVACTGGREGWISIQRDLSSSDAVSIPFTAKNSGTDEVVLQFSWPIPDRQVLELVNDAAATTGSARAPTFDFAWELLSEGLVVSQRESPQRSTGVVETGTEGLA